jgi:uncharacterized lipoprotein YajG
MVSNLLSRIICVNKPSDLKKCDEELGEKVKQSTDRDELMSKITSTVTATRGEALKVSRAGERTTQGIRVTWRTSELTILRK